MKVNIPTASNMRTNSNVGALTEFGVHISSSPPSATCSSSASNSSGSSNSWAALPSLLNEKLSIYVTQQQRQQPPPTRVQPPAPPQKQQSRGEPTELIVNSNTKSSAYDVKQTMALKGYDIPHTNYFAKTLQGSIWRGTSRNCFNQNIVIKVADKSLHAARKSIINETAVHVDEDIVSEAHILRYLTMHGMQHGLQQYMACYVDFFEDAHNYLLVMQDAGSSLFSFVLEAHKYIRAGSLSVSEWQKVCKRMSYQISSCVDILHNQMAVCHLDISLENMLIKDVSVMMLPGHANQLCFIPVFKVKICDFGLAECFDSRANPRFLCSKFVGKKSYKSPEVYAKQSNFDARAADCWSLAVCMFAMALGCMPYNTPCASDQCFAWLMSGYASHLLQQWHKLHYVHKLQLDLLLRVFTPPSQRLTIDQILRHDWFKQTVPMTSCTPN
mmetsp:Transcript_28927/g.45827  ORF Transcript_28927/g.45827 Transcript_28927/m.45827 type:complete len:442 (+) Transcript_28927:166-1491(+)